MPSNLMSLFDGSKLNGSINTQNRKAMIIAAHPDDGEFGAAGTVTLLAAAGWTFEYLVITDGSKGSSDRSIDANDLREIRLVEQHHAAQHLGIPKVTSLNYVDGELLAGRNLLGEIVRQIRIFKPEIIFTHDPESMFSGTGWIHHSDHRITGQMVIDAVYPAARDVLNFPEHSDEGLTTHNVQTIYLWDTEKPNIYVDISDVLDKKISALLSHKSQFPSPKLFAHQSRQMWQDFDGKYREEFRRLDIWA